jgi:predicted Zn-dependent peptidase
MRNIAEEIKMYFDNPISYITMEAVKFIYGNHPLGKNVLGKVSSILSLKQEDFFNFKKRYFNSSNYVFVCVGNIKPENALKLFDEYFEKIPGPVNKRLIEKPSKTTKKTLIKTRNDITQTQVLILAPTVEAKSFEAKVLDLYSVMLSGGMSFPLFQELRDKRGLCYSVCASLDEFSDSSLFSVYLGTDPKKYQEAIKVALEIIDSNKNNQKLMTKAKDLTLGRLSLEFDDPKSILNLAVSNILVGEEPKTYNQIKQEIEKISINDIEEVVNNYLLKDGLKRVLLIPRTKNL